MALLENKIYDEINIGDKAESKRRLTREDIKLFAIISGDVNPAHLDDDYAENSQFHEVIAHGMWGGALISAVLGTQLPGPGTVYLGQSLKFSGPVLLGDEVTTCVEAKEKKDKHHIITFECTVTNQAGKLLISGDATVMAPTEKFSARTVDLPKIRMMERERFAKVVDEASTFEPLRVAVVHPVHAALLEGVKLARESKIIEPVLVGPSDRIHSALDEAQISMPNVEIESTPHSHAAAARAVELVREGRVDTLMKGSLPNSELLAAMLDRNLGIRTGRKMSHIYVFDVPTYPRLLFLSDTGMNINPDVDALADITQNAIDFALAMGLSEPKVALLSAVETVEPKISSTLNAAALCKMADRGQITGGILDGPLAFDNAVSPSAAAVKEISSPVAGEADILIAPDLEAATMLAKQLQYLADAQGAGILMGARVPVIMTSRAADTSTVLLSCALAAKQRRSKQALV